MLYSYREIFLFGAMGEGEGAVMVFIPERTSLEIIGGQSGIGQLVIAPPWQTEEALLVPHAITAWGNAATNLLFLGIDSQVVLQGNLNLLTEDKGAVYVINGTATIIIPPTPIRVQEKVTILPLPAANGQIFFMYYWERLAVPELSRAEIPLPTRNSEELIEERRKRQEAILWKTDIPTTTKALLRQQPEELTHQQERRRQLLEKALIDTKGQPRRS